MSTHGDHHPHEALSAYMDGELEAAERERIDAHLQDCTGCSELLRDLELLRAAGAAEAVPPVPPGLAGRIVAALPGGRRRSWLAAKPLAAAASIAVAAILWSVLQTGGPGRLEDAAIPEEHPRLGDRRADGDDAAGAKAERPPGPAAGDDPARRKGAPTDEGAPAPSEQPKLQAAMPQAEDDASRRMRARDELSQAPPELAIGRAADAPAAEPDPGRDRKQKPAASAGAEQDALESAARDQDGGGEILPQVAAKEAAGRAYEERAVSRIAAAPAETPLDATQAAEALQKNHELAGSEQGAIPLDETAARSLDPNLDANRDAARGDAVGGALASLRHDGDGHRIELDRDGRLSVDAGDYQCTVHPYAGAGEREGLRLTVQDGLQRPEIELLFRDAGAPGPEARPRASSALPRPAAAAPPPERANETMEPGAEAAPARGQAQLELLLHRILVRHRALIEERCGPLPAALLRAE